MKLKIALVTALLMTPSLTLAMGCSDSSEKQAMSCGEGTTYDSATQTCLPVTT
ncbi:MAG: hypothetical protein WBB25_01780 [Sulfitobacter sp.]